MSDEHEWRGDDEETMSPAAWLADSEVAVREPLPRGFLLPDRAIATMHEYIENGGGRGLQTALRLGPEQTI